MTITTEQQAQQDQAKNIIDARFEHINIYEYNFELVANNLSMARADLICTYPDLEDYTRHMYAFRLRQLCAAEDLENKKQEMIRKNREKDEDIVRLSKKIPRFVSIFVLCVIIFVGTFNIMLLIVGLFI